METKQRENWEGGGDALPGQGRSHRKTRFWAGGEVSGSHNELSSGHVAIKLQDLSSSHNYTGKLER